MADVQPLRALHFDQATAGPIADLVAPPYDVIDPAQRAALAARSPYNVVAIDLPESPEPYERAARLFAQWRESGVLVRDEEPAMWVLEQRYAGPDGAERTRRGFFARVRVEEYGPGRVRPHERTHPGPREDRLRLTRATGANLSPIFALYSDPEGAAIGALATAMDAPAWGEVTDAGGHAPPDLASGEPAAIARAVDALADRELLIADGHHRYETSRVYAEEVGGEGDHRYVLMCLVAIEDPGLTVFPTHRLVRGLEDAGRAAALAAAIERDFTASEVDRTAAAPHAGGGPLELGYLDATRALHLTLRDQRIADLALAEMPPPTASSTPACSRRSS